MKKMKKGFTLVELLVTIVLLGIVGGIIIYNMTSVSNNSKETEYERFVAKVKSAASVYADLNPTAFEDLYVSKSYLYITVQNLVEQGLLDEGLVNPYTEQKIGLDELIKANLDSTSGALTFTYPLNDNNQETFMVAISDYVVYGEPYNCMTGAGTYRLALSDEDGNLIQLADSNGNLDGDVIEQYNVQCSFDEDGEFTTYADAGTKDAVKSDGSVARSFDYKSSTKPGTYDITYSWITSSGTKKEIKRSLTVNAELVPEIEFYHSKDNSTFEPQTGDTQNLFQPSLINGNCSTNWNDWDYLIFRPSISGADQATTSYTITAGLNSKDTSISSFKKKDGSSVQLNNLQDYDTYYRAYDGDIYYTINTTVKGHYYKDYSYTSSNVIRATQDLVVADCQISNVVDKWTTSKDYTVDETYHVGDTLYYEYTLGNANEQPNWSDANKVYYDAKTGKYSFEATAVNSTACVSSNSYEYVYVRATNGNYTGTKYGTASAKITNDLYQLLTSDVNVIKTSDLTSSIDSIKDAIDESPNLQNLSYVYRNKNVIIDWGGEKFVVLGLYNDGESILVATDGAVSENRISMSAVKYKKWWIQTCDGLFSTPYTPAVPVFENLTTETESYFETKIQEKISNYASLTQRTTWHARIKEINFDKVPNTAAYFSDTSGYYTRYSQWQYDPSASAQWSAWRDAFLDYDKPYTSYVGAPTEDDYTVFNNALSSYDKDGNNYPYWLATTFQGNDRIARISHGDTLTYKDTNFMAVDKNGTSYDYVANTDYTWSRGDNDSNMMKQCYSIPVNGKTGCEYLPIYLKYTGATAYVKGMMILNPSSVLATNSAATNPSSPERKEYTISTCVDK